MGPSDTGGYFGMGQSDAPYTQPNYDFIVEFVKRYMRTRSAYTACLELGLASTYAYYFGEQLLADGLVQRLIREQEDTAPATKDTQESKRNQYIAWLEELARDYGAGSNHSARVKAIQLLAQMQGMLQPKAEVAHVEPCVMLVPVHGSDKSWEAQAIRSQAELKQQVTSGHNNDRTA